MRTTPAIQSTNRRPKPVSGRTSGTVRATGAQPGPPGWTRRKKRSSVSASTGRVSIVTATQTTVVAATM